MNLRSIGLGLAAVSLFAFGAAAHAAPVNSTGNVTPGVIYGSGNANGAFTGEAQNNIEVGLRAHQRYPAANIFNYDGINTYVFDSTVLTTNPSNRSVFNFDWSINVGSTGLFLDDFSYVLSYDTDASSNTVYASFDPFAGPGYFDHALGTSSTTAGTAVVASNISELILNMATNTVAQQSTNLGFGTNLGVPLSADPDAPGIYNFKLEVFALNTSDLLASSEITVRVNPVPVPGALPLLASGIGVFGLMWRRRRRGAD